MTQGGVTIIKTIEEPQETDERTLRFNTPHTSRLSDELAAQAKTVTGLTSWPDARMSQAPIPRLLASGTASNALGYGDGALSRTEYLDGQSAVEFTHVNVTFTGAEDAHALIIRVHRV